jgi:hypothetical protein
MVLGVAQKMQNAFVLLSSIVLGIAVLRTR